MTGLEPAAPSLKRLVAVPCINFPFGRCLQTAAATKPHSIIRRMRSVVLPKALAPRARARERMKKEHPFKECSLVEVTGLEPAAPCSQSTCATNCATPRYSDIVLVAHYVRFRLRCPASTSLAVVACRPQHNPAHSLNRPPDALMLGSNCATPRNVHLQIIAY